MEEKYEKVTPWDNFGRAGFFYVGRILLDGSNNVKHF